MSTAPRIQLDNILPHVYDELRSFASKALAGEKKNHTLQTTALVHEAYVRLANINEINWECREDVMRAAIGVMRRVLIDYARSSKAQKRDASRIKLTCPNSGFNEQIDPEPLADLLALDEALEKLKELDARKSEIVELRYFGGQTIESVAKIMKVSIATVKRDWALAKAWMHRELN